MGERVFSLTANENSFRLTNNTTQKYSEVYPTTDGRMLVLDYPSPFAHITGSSERIVSSFRWYNIVPIITQMVSNTYNFDPTRPLPANRPKCPEFKRKAWQLTKTTKCVAKAITEEWRKLVALPQYEKYIAFDKKLSRVVGPQDVSIQSRVLFEPEHKVWKDPYLYKDALAYNPCMTLLAKSEIIPKPDWKVAYSSEQSSYHALNATLFSINYSVPYYMLSRLKLAKLQRPLTTRAELLLWLTSHHIHGASNETLNIIRKSTPKDCQKTAKYLRSQGIAINLRESEGYHTLISYLRDYEGEPYFGDMLGLAKRSVAYHELLRQNRIKKQVNLPPETPTAKPPFKYDSIKGAKHLDTVLSIINEGQSMGHCVASYAKSAVKGYCYLFHVEHNKETATVEINPSIDGFRVVQSQGPHNKANSASKYAERKFRELLKTAQKASL